MPTLISPVDDLRDAFAAMATEFADQGEPRYMLGAKDFSAYLTALRDPDGLAERAVVPHPISQTALEERKSHLTQFVHERGILCQPDFRRSPQHTAPPT